MEAYKERMAAEYRELEERTAMGKYMDVLEIRAEIEEVEL